MIGWVFSKPTFNLGNEGREVGGNGKPISIMDNRITDKLAKIREAQTSNIGKKWRISGHTYRGSSGRVIFVRTLVSTTHISC